MSTPNSTPSITAEAARLLDGITPGEWQWYYYPDGRKLLTGEPCGVIHCLDGPMDIDPADAAFIAAAPRLVRGLLAEIEGLRRALAAQESPR